MSERDQSADSPRPTPLQSPTTLPIGERIELQGYQPKPLNEGLLEPWLLVVDAGYQPKPLTEGYRPRSRKDGSSSKPPGDPPKQGPVGRK